MSNSGQSLFKHVMNLNPSSLLRQSINTCWSVLYFFAHSCLDFSSFTNCSSSDVNVPPPVLFELYLDESAKHLRPQLPLGKEDHFLSLAPTGSHFISTILYQRFPLSARQDKSRVAVNSTLLHWPHLGQGSIHPGPQWQRKISQEPLEQNSQETKSLLHRGAPWSNTFVLLL